MTTFLIILVAAAMLATLGVLLAGVFGLARGSDPMRSNVLMRWRVVLQGAALLLVLLLMALDGRGGPAPLRALLADPARGG